MLKCDSVALDMLLPFDPCDHDSQISDLGSQWIFIGHDLPITYSDSVQLVSEYHAIYPNTRCNQSRHQTSSSLSLLIFPHYIQPCEVDQTPHPTHEQLKEL